MKDTFRALVVDKQEETFSVDIRELTIDNLPEGEVLIQVKYSSVNYKDGLASSPSGKIVQSYPFIPGIDLAGTVVSSNNSNFIEGDEVLVTGYDLGVSHFGGFSEYARVPAEWIVHLPKGMSMKEAMIFGTAGFTAALSIMRLEQNGINNNSGPILVTGATGGVGSLAVAMLTKQNYNVVASTGKATEHEFLQNIGAQEILDRHELIPDKMRALDRQRWAGAVDSVGGKTLAYVLSTTKYGGSVAACGLTGGVELPTSVFPFILRGVNLLGIDSVQCPYDIRNNLWEMIADKWLPKDKLDLIANEVTFEQLPEVLSNILQGKVRGRTIVKI